MVARRQISNQDGWRESDQDEPTVEIVQKTKTTKDESRKSWEKTNNEPNNERISGPTPLDNVRRRDKVTKEKERIFVKEDIIEVEDGEEEVVETKPVTEKPVVTTDKKPKVSKSKVKEMLRDEMEDEGGDEDEVGKRVVKMLQRGLL